MNCAKLIFIIWLGLVLHFALYGIFDQIRTMNENIVKANSIIESNLTMLNQTLKSWEVKVEQYD